MSTATGARSRPVAFDTSSVNDAASLGLSKLPFQSAGGIAMEQADDPRFDAVPESAATAEPPSREFPRRLR